MTGKRYFKREWEEGYFIFDSEKITEKEVDEQIDYDVSVFGDALTGDENVELLNHLHEENDVLKQELKTKAVVNRQYEELQTFKKENEKLKQAIAETEKMVQSTYDELTKLRCFKKNIIRIKHSWDYLMEAIQYD